MTAEETSLVINKIFCPVSDYAQLNWNWRNWHVCFETEPGRLGL